MPILGFIEYTLTELLLKIDNKLINRQVQLLFVKHAEKEKLLGLHNKVANKETHTIK